MEGPGERRGRAPRGARVPGTSELGPPLAEVARVLAQVAGVSLAGGLDGALRLGIGAAAASLGVAPEELGRRIVTGDRDAILALVEHSVVGETAFWRHPGQLAAMARLVAEAPGPLRIWSAGCASGEEPYSIAVALLEAGRLGKGDRILATDVSGRALAAAQAGTYGARALRKLPRELAERWLAPGERRRVEAAARALVTFALHNLASDPVPGEAPFDVVFCRNVLIYFTPETARAVLEKVAGAVAPGGILVLGPVELPLASALGLERVRHGGATLLRRSR